MLCTRLQVHDDRKVQPSELNILYRKVTGEDSGSQDLFSFGKQDLMRDSQHRFVCKNLYVTN